MTIIGNDDDASQNDEVSIDSVIHGGLFTAPISGTLDSISMHINVLTATRNHKAAVYSSDLTTLIGSTDEEAFAPADYAWKTVNFSTKPSLTASTEYYLCAWSGGGGDTNMHIQDSVAESYKLMGLTIEYDGWPADASGADTWTTVTVCIYGTYTEIEDSQNMIIGNNTTLEGFVTI